MPEEEMIGDGEMKNNINTDDSNVIIDLEHYRRLVRTNIDMVRFKIRRNWYFNYLNYIFVHLKIIYFLSNL